MKISIDKTPSGTSLKCYIPKSEIHSTLGTTQNSIKDFRKQKTYKTTLSKQKTNVLESVLDNLFSNFILFASLNTSSYDSSYDLVKNKVYKNLEPSLDEYQKKSFEEVYSIAKSFVFDIYHIDEMNTIKGSYNLANDSDILVSIIGAFRYGKTTLIKKLFGFDDDYVFPLVDKGRTSLSNCFFRALLVRNGQININVADDMVSVLADDYKFCNKITLQSFDEFFNLTLESSLFNAFELYCYLMRDENNNIDDVHSKVLGKFISHDKANLDEIFGDIDIELDEFYLFMLNSFKEEYNNIDESTWEYDENDNLQVPHKNRDFLTKNRAFYNFTIEYLENKLQSIIIEISNSTHNHITHENNTLSFKLNRSDIGDIDLYYNSFVNNNSKKRGKLFRLLVSEIYTEIDLELEDVVKSDSRVIKQLDHLTSIVLTDTMGAGHKSNKNIVATDSSNDIINNLPLLNESDIILLLDDASQSMKDVTLSQIESLVNFGLHDKLLLTYSWYDYFLKNDMKNDEERVKILCKILEEKLNEIFNKSPNLSKRIYSAFTQNNLERILFLKGLVQYIPKNNTEERTSRRRKKKDTMNTTNDDMLAELLNNGTDFNENMCFESLLKKIVLLNNNIKEMNNSSFTLNINASSADAAYNFFEMYNNFYKDFITSQHNEYIQWTPSFKTTEALCKQLTHEKTGFSGISRELYPYNDAISIFVKHFDSFLENHIIIEIAEDKDGEQKDNALNKDFILNKIKINFSKKISEFFKLLIVVSNKNDWLNYYNDWGYGVQDRRANKIYSLLTSTLKVNKEKKDTNISVSLYTFFQTEVDKIVNQYNNN